jgi:hypothetical protein
VTAVLDAALAQRLDRLLYSKRTAPLGVCDLADPLDHRALPVAVEFGEQAIDAFGDQMRRLSDQVRAFDVAQVATLGKAIRN